MIFGTDTFSWGPKLIFNNEYQGPICPCPQVPACCDEDGEGISDLDNDGVPDGQDADAHDDEITTEGDYLKRFDIESSMQGIVVSVKWNSTTNTYDWRGLPHSFYQNTGKVKASEVKNSSMEASGNGGVKARVDAGQGLKFENLSPADAETPTEKIERNYQEQLAKKKAREEAERKAREEAERKAKEEADRKAKEEAEKNKVEPLIAYDNRVQKDNNVVPIAIGAAVLLTVVVLIS
tara:strand:+ start:3769 stop:4476 length:708 start_codon:yes stop_codon:yes gene_type:complete